MCPVISTNIYKLTGQYVVQLPNGKLKQNVSGDEGKYESEAKIVAIEYPKTDSSAETSS